MPNAPRLHLWTVGGGGDMFCALWVADLCEPSDLHCYIYANRRNKRRLKP